MTVYLIHLAQPYHHACHYLGCTHDLAHRVAMHRKGTGAKLLRAVSRAGIPFEVVRTWDGYYEEELQLKARKNAPKLCPVCLQEQVRTRLGIRGVTLHDLLPTPAPDVCQEVLV
jgi:predicted GIY-YIG superfamily endonuclease